MQPMGNSKPFYICSLVCSEVTLFTLNMLPDIPLNSASTSSSLCIMLLLWFFLMPHLCCKLCFIFTNTSTLFLSIPLSLGFNRSLSKQLEYYCRILKWCDTVQITQYVIEYLSFISICFGCSFLDELCMILL